MDFSNLEKLNVAGKSAKMYLSELDSTGAEPAYLELRIADESNLPWYNAIMERAVRIAGDNAKGHRRRVATAEKGFTKDEMAANRERDAELFPKYIIIGWGGITNAAGKEVEWSIENAKALVEQLCKSAPRIFDEIRAFAQTVGNYMDDDDDCSPIDPTPLVEN